MAQFESKNNSFKLVKINMDKKGSAEFQQYIQHFQGRGIPYWAVLDASGKKVHGFAGGQSYDSLVKATRKYK